MIQTGRRPSRRISSCAGVRWVRLFPFGTLETGGKLTLLSRASPLDVLFLHGPV